jgi:phosphohistidine phosphatase
MIYLLRHGTAERGDGDDAARKLTEAGERESVAAGRAIAALGLNVDACLTSPKVRALDTARLACEALAVEPEVQGELAGSGYDATALATGLGDVVLVGHNPDFTTELKRLTGANAKLRKGGLAIIDGSLLLALLRPEELEAIADSRR